tara:strand:+ start:2562 stop:2777 length:216 start_codon:yes stop_codon:yes gene_type:complete
MGVLRRPKYEETETDKMIKRQMETEEKDRVKKEEARAERKRRIAKGMVGSRSMFSKAGGRGFYDDEGNKYS